MISSRGRFASLILLVGCGRIGFDGTTTSADRTDGGIDAAFACSVPTTAPPIVRISGRAFHFTGFTNQTSPVPQPSVFVREAGGAAGGTTGADDGTYSMNFPTMNVPISIELEFSQPAFMTTVMVPDVPLAHDTMVDSMLWSVGEGQMWSAGAMGTVYNAVSLTRQFGQGTLNVAVADCAGNPVEGATIIIDPPPPIGVVYLAVDGLPTAALTSTVAPFTYGISFNAIPGPTTITAQKQGYVFGTQTFDVRADVITVAIVRPRE